MTRAEQRTPRRGLHFPVPLGVSGRYRVMVLDEFGNIERGRGGVPVARDPSGFLRRVGDWHRNLITNQGMDHIATERWAVANGADGQARDYLHLGDGSASPANTDTSLSNQVATTQSDGGNNGGTAGSDDGTDITLTGTVPRVYVNSTGVGQNFSEYGHSPDGGASNLGVRELLRDGSDNPITITLNDGKKLRLDHAADLVIPIETTIATLDVPEYDTGGSVVQTRSFTNARVLAWAYEGTYFSYLEPSNTSTKWASSAARTKADLPASFPAFYDYGGTYTEVTRGGLLAYTPGSYKRERYAGLGEAYGNNNDINSIIMGRAGTADESTRFYGGYVVSLQDGPHPKVNTHTLDFFVELSWSRV